MVRFDPFGHDGCMNDTQEAPRTAGPDDEFDPHKLRTIADVKRSTDDRWVAGVCSGVARYLNIDPVIVRIVIAVLTIVGFAGAILYAAAWLLLPSEDADKSIAAGWFNLDENEEQVRKIGLVIAGIIAVFSLLGDSGNWWGVGWILVPVAALYYFFVVRPRKTDKEADQGAGHGRHADERDRSPPTSRPRSTRRSPRRSPTPTSPSRRRSRCSPCR